MKYRPVYPHPVLIHDGAGNLSRLTHVTCTDDGKRRGVHVDGRPDDQGRRRAHAFYSAPYGATRVPGILAHDRHAPSGHEWSFTPDATASDP